MKIKTIYVAAVDDDEALALVQSGRGDHNTARPERIVAHMNSCSPDGPKAKVYQCRIAVRIKP